MAEEVLDPIVAKPDILGHLEPARQLNSMTEADYVRLVETFTRATLQKDLDYAMSFVADDVEYWNLPDRRPHRGKEAARAFLDPIWNDPKSVYFAFKIFRTVASGRVVFHERIDLFRRDKAYLEVPLCGLYVFDDDNKIAIWHDYFDPGAFTTILDHVEVLPEAVGEPISHGWTSRDEG